MAEGMNRLTLVGNLGMAPETRATQSGTTVLRFRMATTERVKAGSGYRDQTEWHTAVVFGRRGEALSRVLQKGSRVLVEGPIRHRSWEDRDGKKRTTTEVHASRVLLLGAKPSAGAEDPWREKTRTEYDPSGAGAEFGDDDIPF